MFVFDGNITAFFSKFPIFERTFCKKNHICGLDVKLPVPLLFWEKIKTLKKPKELQIIPLKKGKKQEKTSINDVRNNGIFIQTERAFFSHLKKNILKKLYKNGYHIQTIIYFHHNKYKMKKELFKQIKFDFFLKCCNFVNKDIVTSL